MRCNRANKDKPSRLIGKHIHSATWTGENGRLGSEEGTIPGFLRRAHWQRLLAAELLNDIDSGRLMDKSEVIRFVRWINTGKR